MIASFGDRIRELHRSLEAAAVVHAFGGAIALVYAVHEPRNTRDIDINISVPVAEAARVLDALPIPWSEEDLRAIQQDGQVRLRWSDDLPVDLFFPQHRFHDVVRRRSKQVDFGGTVIPVISPTDLAVFKTMFNRSRDWADIESMLEAGSVDITEAKRWLAEILGADSGLLSRFAATAERVAVSPGRPDKGDPNPWRALDR